MKKLILYASLLLAGVVSCTKEYTVPQDELPSFLGESIYAELQNPKNLEGTFNTYLKLIDEMDYANVLGKTGSKTIFPANDEAFEAFFAGNNVFGVSSYDELTYAQKAQLLFSSMLDNAILVGNLSNKQNSAGELLQGQIIKHPTNMTLVQSVEPFYSQRFPANNKYFEQYIPLGGINVVNDNTIMPMVHFTGEYMLNNAMTVTGENSDFEVVTGSPYEDGATYIYDHKVIRPNVTCQNGYIHQVDGVLMPPGNMAKVMRDDSELSLFSRMIDYYSVPLYDAKLTSDYNSWAIENGLDVLDRIYAVRYFSFNSQRNKLDRYTNEEGRTSDVHTDGKMLNFDPGWNYFNPTVTGGSVSNDAEIAAILAPTDDALWDYFKENGGGGSYIIKNLGARENTRENFPYNLDAIYNNDPTVFSNIINNLMKPYFSKTVPSKFKDVQNDAFEFMGVTVNDIQKVGDKYDVKIGNNGVIYKMNKLFAPQIYNSVLGPASIYANMRSMGQMLNDHAVTAGTPSALGADMYYYLLSMKSNYAVFVPEDNESFCFIDPTSIYDTDGIKALRFRFDNAPVSEGKFNVMVQKGLYVGGKFEGLAEYPEENIATGTYKSQIQDMLNYHTVVFDANNKSLYGNRFYKTKHGGAIYVPQGVGRNGQTVLSGTQIYGGVAPSKILKQYSNQSNPDADKDATIINGTSYLLDRPIQPVTTSAYRIMQNNFEKFIELMDGFDAYDYVLTFAGISNTKINENSDKTEQTAYKMFEISHENKNNPDLSDYRLRMLGAYNYTIYAPTDAAMAIAHSNGLPTWEEVEAIYKQWNNKKSDPGFAAEQAKARKMIDTMRSFVYYHIQNSSVFADKNVDTNVYQTLMTDEKGITRSLYISGGDGKLYVEDAASRANPEEYKAITLDWDEPMTNRLARDIVIKNKAIESSAFITIHGINRPLCFNASGKYME